MQGHARLSSKPAIGYSQGSQSPGDTQYSRSLAMTKSKDVIIAYQMNGEEISRDHGFPLRVVVPGHYGMAWVKWLTGIRVLTELFKGYWQTSGSGSGTRQEQ